MVTQPALGGTAFGGLPALWVVQLAAGAIWARAAE
jgi:hypothetical protein